MKRRREEQKRLHRQPMLPINPPLDLSLPTLMAMNRSGNRHLHRKCCRMPGDYSKPQRRNRIMDAMKIHCRANEANRKYPSTTPIKRNRNRSRTNNKQQTIALTSLKITEDRDRGMDKQIRSLSIGYVLLHSDSGKARLREKRFISDAKYWKA
mmetsp:Transcript_9046/g.13997  ORF Transcript_9046/g.13997 Transcript_9046/m.13997 type:complete len:153 (-) Transcript_9046:192-650(-)